MSSRNSSSVGLALGIAVFFIIAILIGGVAVKTYDDARTTLATSEIVALAESLSERMPDTYGEGGIQDFTGVLTAEHSQDLLGRTLSKDYDYEVSLEDDDIFLIIVTKVGSHNPFLTYHSADGLVIE